MPMIHYDSGCKVAWEWFDNEAEANERGATARAEAIDKANRGYDFGYQSPGSVQHYENHPTHGEAWRVCIP